jgi:hypothetical protein
MPTLKNKCLFVSVFDAVAYQHPALLQQSGISTPMNLVHTILSLEWPPLLREIKECFLKDKPHPHNSIVLVCVCKYLGINICSGCIDVHPRVKHDLANISNTFPTIFNITDFGGTNHVEFEPFPYVRTREDLQLYETLAYAARVQRQGFTTPREEMLKELKELMQGPADDYFSDEMIAELFAEPS